MTVEAERVDAVVGKIVEELGTTLNTLPTALGVRAGLWSALAGAGALSPGDETERARKTVTARIRDALGRIERVHPALGEHLRAAVSTGTTCAYTPFEPTPWKL